jgi:alcohol dehydrogenase (cytochrome c)
MPVLKPIKLILVCAGIAGLWQGAGVVKADSGDLLANLSPVSDTMLAAPSASDWLMWRRTYDGFGFSPLDQITKANVADLELAWTVPLESGSNMATPLVHDGVMYLLSTHDTMLAMDATSGELLWRHKYEGTPIYDGVGSAKIGLALYDNKVLMPTGDMRMLALDSKSGEVIWNTEIVTTQAGPIPYSLRAAPIVANGMVIQGVTATMVPEGGFIVGLDLTTGAEVWRFQSIARPDAAGGNTWNDLELPKRSGGSVWIPGSYDPGLDLIYFGTAPTYDTASLLYPVDKPGISTDALYTNSTVALRPKTGELVWHYQHMANDQWDLDWIYERQLIELPIDGVDRQIVLTAGKMALYDAIDAATGEYVFSIDLGLQNLVSAIDPITGAKTLNPNAAPNAEDTRLVCPFANGGRNWQSAAYNPDTKMLYLPLSEICMNGGPTGNGGLLSSGSQLTPTPLPDSDGKFGRMQAVNLGTRELDWSFREVVSPTSAALATAGGVVFGGALDESFKAFDDASGEILWQTDLGDIPASFPISYSVDGEQYIAVIIGQPSLHANIMIGVVTGFLGIEQSPVTDLDRTGAAVVVYALSE